MPSTASPAPPPPEEPDRPGDEGLRHRRLDGTYNGARWMSSEGGGDHTAQVAPTIDGLGPQGSHAHSPDEYIELGTLIERARVAARFVELWTERFEA
jgi:acetylornithine deacetylase/succinyl-diaminopimelate desuccinylase-like protein